MIKSYLLSVFALASACAENIKAESFLASDGKYYSAIQAFRNICLETAPDFSKAASAAKKHGIADVTDMGFMLIGLSADKNMSIQIKAGKECALTTPSQQDDSLTRQLLDAARELSSTPVGQTSPAKITLAGQIFILAHDRNDGEAYVLLKIKH